MHGHLARFLFISVALLTYEGDIGINLFRTRLFLSNPMFPQLTKHD